MISMTNVILRYHRLYCLIPPSPFSLPLPFSVYTNVVMTVHDPGVTEVVFQKQNCAPFFGGDVSIQVTDWSCYALP